MISFLSLLTLSFMLLFVPMSTGSFCRADDSPVAIGEIDPLTGSLAKHGEQIHEGIVYAVEEINGHGGIDGRPVELISRDDQSQPDVAINQAEELLYGHRVAGLVGGYVDSLVGPISELANKHHTAYVASASLQRGLTLGRKNPYFFRVSNLDGVVRPLCGFLTSALRPERAALLFAATPGASEFAEAVRQCLDADHVEVPVFEKFRPGSPDFSALLLKLRQKKADVLISGGFFPDHLILARQFQEQHIPLRAYIGPWGIAYPGFMEEMGAGSEHLIGMCAWNPGITLPGTEKESDDFVRGFSKRFGKVPDTTTMHGYTSARALLSAMDQAAKDGSGLTGDAVAAKLRLTDLKLPMERLRFDANGDPKDYDQVVVQIQNGRMVAVYPPDRAAGKLE